LIWVFGPFLEKRIINAKGPKDTVVVWQKRNGSGDVRGEEMIL